MHTWNLIISFSHFALHFFYILSVLFLARSSTPVPLSLSFPFSVSQVREIVCVSNIRALSTACALISCSQTWGNMSARIQYQPFQHWANGLLSERAEKQTRMTQTRTPIHTSPFYLCVSLSLRESAGDLSMSSACLYVFACRFVQKNQ